MADPHDVDAQEQHREALRERYRLEREKRLRPDGPDQYQPPTGRFANLADDPYTPRGERPPVQRDATFAFIGAGFAGLATGARLAQAGIDDVVLIDTAGDVGGVWYWNRYPGAMCDTAAMIYLPLLEETGYLPSQKYVFAPEIFGHAQRIADRFGLRDQALLSTGVTDVAWDEGASRWIIRTDRGDEVRARFVGIGTGPMHRPKLPGIPGIHTFGGHAFHTSRWDYAYTGGDPAGAPMDGLADKRVGIIGTGATAIQCIPRLGRDAGELFVFQRTPSSVDVRNNHPLDAAELDLSPGWQRRWLFNFATLQTGGFVEPDLVKDGWTDISKRIRDRVVAMVSDGAALDADTMLRAFEDSDDEKMDEIRARIDAIVEDPATADALKPWYRQLCKRPCFHDEYLQTYNRPNVHLVDTDGQGVTRIDETGCWIGDRHVELDCLVLASGFEVGTDTQGRSGFQVRGRDGRVLADHWADGLRTMHGIHVHGFPNLFVQGISQGAALISNVTSNYVEAAGAIAAVVARAVDDEVDAVEVTAEAEEGWMEVLSGARSLFGGIENCTPGYYNNEGQPMSDAQRRTMAGYPQGPVAFFEMLEGWAAEGSATGEFAGLSRRPGQSAG